MDPLATPDTTPVVLPIDAIAALPLLQIPPPIVLANVVVCPRHTMANPEIEPAEAEITVSVVVLVQPAVDVNVMIVVPLATPVITPVVEPTVATLALPLLHVPVAPVIVTVAVDKAQILLLLMVIVESAGRIVSVVVV